MNEIAPTHVTETAMPDVARIADGQPACETGPEAALCARAPIGMLCELTHRCPLQCPYCSNPVELERANAELTTAEWQDVMRQAAQLGVLQIHLSGGEPTARKDLEEIVRVAAEVGLYTNLITAGVTLTRERLAKLAEVGLDHVQLSIQDVDPENADRIAAYKGGMKKKIEVAGWVRELGLPLTINAPIHRQNIHNVARTIEFAVEMGAGRVEIAHVQYYAWALVNRASLMPTKEAFLKAAKQVEEAREKYKGVIVIDAIVPDYYAKFPKPCMGG
ncbi:MAG: radical SAM protein, partial [Hyphomicrobium sp.]